MNHQNKVQNYALFILSILFLSPAKGVGRLFDKEILDNLELIFDILLETVVLELLELRLFD